MFTSNHAIWKFASAGDELDDWLPYAEDLIRKWSSQRNNEVKFQTTFEIIIAAFLLKDGLLPASAQAAFAEIVLATIDEAGNHKLRLNCLHISPPKPGRKENRTETYIRLSDVRRLIQEGKTASEAYQIVAEQHFKSPDTIRREYERRVVKKPKRKQTGETINDFPGDFITGAYENAACSTQLKGIQTCCLPSYGFPPLNPNPAFPVQRSICALLKGCGQSQSASARGRWVGPLAK